MKDIREIRLALQRDASVVARCLTPVEKCAKKSKSESRKNLLVSAGVTEQVFSSHDVKPDLDEVIIDGGKCLGDLLYACQPSKADAAKGASVVRKEVSDLFQKANSSLVRMVNGHHRATLVMDEREFPDDPPILHKAYERMQRSKAGKASSARADEFFEENFGTSLVEEVFSVRPFDARTCIAHPEDAPRSPGLAAAFPEQCLEGESLREIFADRRSGSLVPEPFSGIWKDRAKARPELIAAVLASFIDAVNTRKITTQLRIVGAERFPVEEAYGMLLEKRARHSDPLGCFGADGKGLKTITNLALCKSVIVETTLQAGAAGPYGLGERSSEEEGTEVTAPVPHYTRLYAVSNKTNDPDQLFPTTAAESLRANGHGFFDIVVVPPSETNPCDLSLFEGGASPYNFDIHSRDFEAAAAAAEAKALELSDELSLDIEDNFKEDLEAVTKAALKAGFGLDCLSDAPLRAPLERFLIDTREGFEGLRPSDFFIEDELGEAVAEGVPLLVRRPGFGFLVTSCRSHFYGEADQGVLKVLSLRDDAIFWPQIGPTERKRRSKVAPKVCAPARSMMGDLYARLEAEDEAEAKVKSFIQREPIAAASEAPSRAPRIFVHASDNDFFPNLLLHWACSKLTTADEHRCLGEAAYRAALASQPDIIWVLSSSYGANGASFWAGYRIDRMARELASRIHLTTTAPLPKPSMDNDKLMANIVLNVVFLFLAFGFGDYTPGLAGVGATSAGDSILGTHAPRRPFVTISVADNLGLRDSARVELLSAARAFRALFAGMLLVKKRHPKTSKAAHKKNIEKCKAELLKAADGPPHSKQLAMRELESAERASEDLRLRFQAKASAAVEEKLTDALSEVRDLEEATDGRAPTREEAAEITKAQKRVKAAVARVSYGSFGGNDAGAIGAEEEYRLLESLLGPATLGRFLELAGPKRASPVLISDAELASRCAHAIAVMQFNLEAIKGDLPLPFEEVSGFYASNGKPIYLSSVEDFGISAPEQDRS